MKPGLTSGYKQEIRRSLDFYQEKGESFNTQTGLEKQQELPEELPRGLDKRNAECLGRAGLEKGKGYFPHLLWFHLFNIQFSHMLNTPQRVSRSCAMNL